MDSEKLYRRFLAVALISTIGAISLGGCTKTNSGHNVCETLAAMGDSDCDLVLDQYDKHPGYDDLRFDTDGDGIPDMIDLYPSGNNYSDLDHDGFPNVIDRDPLNPNVTVRRIPSPQENQAAQQQAINRQTENMIADNKRRQQASEELTYELRHDQANVDTDQDGVSDIYDSLPYLNNYDDEDGDGSPNSADLFPYRSDMH